MLANVGGSLALGIGLVVLLLPLLTPELSRPRDAAWGALVLLLGLALVTSSDRPGPAGPNGAGPGGPDRCDRRGAGGLAGPAPPRGPAQHH